MSRKTVEVNITGIVQGVGFRPFLFNLARDHKLNGYVLNRGNAGVRLVIQGKPTEIQSFLKDLKRKKPNISYIEKIDTIEVQSEETFDELTIRKSEQGRGISLTLPPDVAICENCLKEMRNPDMKRYNNYPFIACAVCGPRYTTVTSLPYDRERSTMINFPFCEACMEEYKDFDNRRFHAQTYACSICGPNYKLYDRNKKLVDKKNIEEILQETGKRINNGEIGAIKGIGGVHLVCLSNDDGIITKLRKRKKRRKFKPFALMVPNLDIIKDYFYISEKEKSLIQSFRRPIVLLRKKKSFVKSDISELVAPGLNYIGFMLPYTAIHYLLFDYLGNNPLIYTSGNTSNTPMGIVNKNIFTQLYGIADFYLLHNRIIHQRVDDSVLRIHDDEVKLIRRSRGYVPEYIPLPFQVKIPAAIATGPELSVTGAVLRRNRIFPTQHIGNVSNLETFNFLKDAISHIQNLLQIKDKEIKFIACDAHPVFITSKYAKDLSNQYSVALYKIQHHYSHILGLIAENQIPIGEKIIGISTDGVGYGEDGNIWGGEILLSSYEKYERIGHLEYQPMIGGDRCTKYPARMLTSIILNNFGLTESREILNKLHISKDLEYKESELEAIINQYKNAKNHFPAENVPLTSSTGRIFDAVSYILGACVKKTYRGEPAMRLEALAAYGDARNINYKNEYIEGKGTLNIINTSKLIIDTLNLVDSGKYSNSDIAAWFQEQISKSFAFSAIESAEKLGISKIGLSGGVAYNYSFSNNIKNEVLNAGLEFLEHNIIPPGDAGISIGQLIGGIFNYYKDQDY
ncbi:MAG: carbamoyltransferase HypF [Candidatus Lokiarchaeota archaeon]|nr:carbamoyltransferase HypF [Candidatus Lokiarchaeota archaeon]MBD3201900.1 carbamoyltransferase HypF [Candidatus Lokiarchaeota archaeon]